MYEYGPAARASVRADRWAIPVMLSGATDPTSVPSPVQVPFSKNVKFTFALSASASFPATIPDRVASSCITEPSGTVSLVLSS